MLLQSEQVTVDHNHPYACETSSSRGVGLSRLNRFIHRIKYIGRFLFWSARHRSFARGHWVAELEG
jgi:hypothetical protein